MAKSHKLADGRYECQNCLKKFTKTPGTYKEPLFCCNTCRYQFHAQGGMSLKRLESKVHRFVEEACRPLVLRIAALEEIAAAHPKAAGRVPSPSQTRRAS